MLSKKIQSVKHDKVEVLQEYFFVSKITKSVVDPEYSVITKPADSPDQADCSWIISFAHVT